LGLAPIQFDTASANIRAESFGTLDEAAEVMLANPDDNVEIQGHTDSRGDDLYNLQLSDARAASVKDYLADKGVEVDRMEANGYGEQDLKVDPEESDEDLQANRRIEFVLK